MTLEILTHPALHPLRHGFFTRKGGASSGLFAGLNCGRGSSDQQAIVAINRARVAAAMGVGPDRLATVHQTHSDKVVTLRQDDDPAALAGTEAPRRWDDWTASLRAHYETWQTPKPTPGAVRMEQVVCWLSANLPDDAILTNGAGNYASFVHRYFRFKRARTQIAPTSGSMGYGLPAAIAAKIAHPDRTVICMAGDGCLQMTVNELSTAAQEGAAVIVIVANNGRYGTIRMHQERHYPGRVSGTDLFNPDLPDLVRAYGGHGELVTADDQAAGAIERALRKVREERVPAIVNVIVAQELGLPE